MSVHPAKTQISLGIHPVWSESSLSAWRNLGSLATHWAHSEDSDQTGQMPRLIWVNAGRTATLLVLSSRGSVLSTPQPLYNTMFGVQANFCVSYPHCVTSREKCIGNIRKGTLNSHLESSLNPCFNQNRLITNHVIKRFRWTIWSVSKKQFKRE